jgi:GNAT superfamily N-acetyltransferase
MNSNPAYEIHPAKPDELDAIVDLLGRQLREHQIDTGLDEVRSVIERILTDPRFGFVLIARGQGGRAVGVALGAAFLGIEYGGVSGWIEELYVLPEFRDQGIGTRLVAEFISIATRLGWRAIDIEVDSGHRRVESLYGRHGFQPVTRARFCRKL